jgi:hypothetical protein
MLLSSCLSVFPEMAQLLTKWGVGLFLSDCCAIVHAKRDDLQPGALTGSRSVEQWPLPWFSADRVVPLIGLAQRPKTARLNADFLSQGEV